MKRVQTILLATAVALVLVPLTGGTAQAVWGHGRVVTNYSLPSVPAYSTGYAPVVAGYAPVVVGRPVYSAPVVAASPVIVGAPTYAASPVVVRGLFGRPRFIAAAPAGVVASPVVAAYAPSSSAAPVSTYYAPAYSSAPVSTYYAPTYSAPTYSAPVSTYYAPGASVVLPPITIR